MLRSAQSPVAIAFEPCHGQGRRSHGRGNSAGGKYSGVVPVRLALTERRDGMQLGTKQKRVSFLLAKIAKKFRFYFDHSEVSVGSLGIRSLDQQHKMSLRLLKNPSAASA
ncbi:uncharacterized protein CIMG_07080 [Coccidioides immitis RS]|uniref:Uncharacterized protein n=4 Tax=Coccidioides immitis TaxID=5501 RepID=J3K9K8_COCIM|nr:uncharacterized protein CIMG_07080 [Coccidioides immitis RS]EAS31601.3 hypothetical protein CIMG_07080 [Coccidioides immitis RS]KMP04250.1 hypothetical protein CIRG_03941 [Coccidioides immitis RMSCC 2394]KMU73380.1 hypothetical protein CISG_03515 [Coccidioides immitis RMSCC 3703]KMU87068.1 hypothetical protein CIHG_05008 [Coccidioides immitis H538.4]